MRALSDLNARHLTITAAPFLPAFGTPGVALLLCTLISLSGQGLDFSLRSGSPKVPSPFSAADIIEATGGSVRIPAASLGGSAASSDLADISYGQSEAADVNVSPYFYKRLAYSVKHGALGNGTPIATEVAIDGAAGDTFALDFIGYRNSRFIVRSPFTLVKAQVRNLTVQTSPSAPEDDIDGLALHRNSNFPVYLTFAPGGSYDPATIYIVKAAGGPPEIFASPADLGLAAGDVIDGISIGTIPFGSPPPTALAPNVVVWLSLAAGSPSRAAGPDSIFQAWPAPHTTVLTAAQLNLAFADEIDAIAVLDPGGSVATSVTSHTGNLVATVAQDGSTNSLLITTSNGPDGNSVTLTRFSGEITNSSGTLTPIAGSLLPGAAAINNNQFVASVSSSSGAWKNPDGATVGGQGSYFAFFDPSLTPCGPPIQLSPNPNLAVHKLLLSGDALYTILAIPTANAVFGETVLNPDSNVSTVFVGSAPYLCTANQATIGAATGYTIQALDKDGKTSVNLATAPGADIQKFDDKIVSAKALRATGFGSPIANISLNPVGSADPLTIIPTQGNAPIMVFYKDSVRLLPKFTIIPATGLISAPFVDALKFTTPDILIVSIQAFQTFNLLGQTFGKSGSTLQLIKIDLSGATPKPELLFSSDPLPSAVTLETTSFALKPPDLIGWIGNSYRFPPGTPFTISVRNPDGSAAFNINNSGGAAEGFGCIFKTDTRQIDATLNAFSGEATDASTRIAKFAEAYADNSGIHVFGLSPIEGSVLLPGNLSIPFFPGTPPRQVFRASFRPIAPPTEVPPPTIRARLTADLHFNVEFTDTLETSENLRDWTPSNARSPLIIDDIPSRNNSFFRAKREFPTGRPNLRN